MKIGRFSKMGHVSVDTVRHYIDLGLVVPEKIGAHFEFDELCSKDLAHVLQLKDMGFQLKEIQRIFAMIRLGAATPKSEVTYIIEEFQERIRAIESEENVLAMRKNTIHAKLEELKALTFKESVEIGVSLNQLSLLACRKCKSSYVPIDAHIQKSYIIEGQLGCNCGTILEVKRGIVVGDTFFKKPSSKMDLNMQEAYEDYVKSTDQDFLDELYKSMDWIKKKINNRENGGSNLLELGVGSGMFLRHFINDLNQQDVYIAVDHDYERLLSLKAMLEANGVEKKLLLICSDFLSMPLIENVADIVLDLSGSVHYAFDHNEPLLPLISPWVKSETFVMGAYIVFDHLYKNEDDSIRCEQVFNVNGIKDIYAKSRIEIIEDSLSPVISGGGKYEEMYQVGKNMRAYRSYGVYKEI